MGHWDNIRNVFRNLKRLTGKPSDEIQPRDILDRLVTELERKKKLGIDENAFVPNVYVVYLSPSDYEELSPLLTGIRDQLRNKLMDRIKKHGYRLLSVVLTLDIREDGGLQKGQAVIESAFLKEKTSIPVPVEETVRTTSQTAQAIATRQPVVLATAAPKAQLTRLFEDKKTIIIDKTKLRLDVIEGESKDDVIGLKEGEYTFGRGRDASILIKDNDEMVSRIHFKIFIKEGVIRIKDLNSANGTRVNDIDIEETELKKGDTIAAGKVLLRVA